MAVTAHFIADFSSFTNAVNRAEVELKSFETETSKVQKSLNRMGDSFSGRKVLQESTLMVKAVEEIGGATKLTAAEQKRVNVAVTEALDKYKALGLQAPASMVRLAAETGKVQLSLTQVATAVGAVAGIVTGLAAGVATLGERGAGVADVRAQFEALTTAIGESSDAMLGRLREATLGNVSDFELMAAANTAMSQGLALTSDQMGTLADTAAVLADRTGGDVKEAYETLLQAMATGQDRTLKTIGLNIDAAAATKSYADQLGIAVSEMTEAQRIQAIQNSILEQGRAAIELSGKAQADFGDKVASSRTALSNFVDTVGEWIATTPEIGTFSSAITAASSTVTALGLAWGPVSAGVAKLIPLLGASGVMGAFSSLASVITTTVLPLISSALPIALRALAALFSFPAGLVIAGIAAVVTVWKNWDTIGPIVQKVYTAVKTWLVDKFNAIVQSIKDKVAAVTGFFAEMYDKVVGNSYVPDMIAAIASEFGKLQSSMVQPAQSATQQTAVFFSSLLGVATDVLGQLNSIFRSAFTGGGGIAGAVKSLATTATEALLNMIPLVGPFLSQFSGAIIAGLSRIGGAVGGFFRNLFGGPSGDELAGRQLVEAFEQNLSSMLTESQRMEAGNDAWKQTVIYLRDAYLAMGRTEQEALLDAERLWASSREGAGASAEVIAEIEGKLRGVGEAGSDAAAAIAESFDSVGEDTRAVVENMAADAESSLSDMVESGRFSAEEIEDAQRAAALKIKLAYEELARMDIKIPVTFDVDQSALDRIREFGSGATYRTFAEPSNVAEVVPMAAGGMGTATKPTLFLAGEDGPEEFAFSGANRKLEQDTPTTPTVIQLVVGRKVLAETMIDSIGFDDAGIRRVIKRVGAA